MLRYLLAHLLRAAPALALAVTLLTAPAPARADAPVPEHMHTALRVQVVVKSVYIWDEREFVGDGEFELKGRLTCYALTQPCPGSEAELTTFVDTFSGGQGDTISRNLVYPRNGDTFHPDYDASATSGYPLYLGQAYELRFEMKEKDSVTKNELMGQRHIVLRPETGWGLGTHTLRATQPRGWGDYTIEFEVRKAPLADLQPRELKVRKLAGSTRELVCLPVFNGGEVDAGAFGVAFRVNGVVPPGGRVDFGGLAAGDTREQCIEAEVPDSGLVELGMVIDEGDRILEIAELNNYHIQAYAGGPALQDGVSAPDATLPATDADGSRKPSASQGKADLTVSAITVSGQVPDGRNACTNAVVVAVKNAGTADVGDFALHLLVDGDQATEQSVTGLEAGQERRVRFEDVRLKKGTHTVTAIADPNKAVAEANEDNNELKVTAQCKDDN